MGPGLVYGCVVPHPPILVPAVAGHRLQQVCRTREAMQQVAGEIRELAPDSLVLVSPHAPIRPRAMGLSAAEGYVAGFEAFGAPSVRLSLRGDPALAATIEAECCSFGVPTVCIGRREGYYHLDHGAAVPLFYLQEAGVPGDLVLVSFSALERDLHRRFGRAIAAAARETGKRVVLVASGDFSHRLFPGAPAGYSPRGCEFDERIVSALRRRDYAGILHLDEDLLHEAGECGYRSLLIALGALPEAEAEVLSYEGPFGVGYLVARFQVGTIASDQPEGAAEAVTPEGLAADEQEALRLARLAVESYVREGRLLAAPPKPTGMLARRAGVFVSLKIGGDLRGCIGTFQATEPTVAAEILRNAVAAATRDPRFLPVTRKELLHLQYSLDILSTPEPVDGMDQLDPKRFGVIVQAGSRRGLLLPDLEGVSTVETQVDIARRKAGIPAGTPVQLYRFTVRRIRE